MGKKVSYIFLLMFIIFMLTSCAFPFSTGEKIDSEEPIPEQIDEKAKITTVSEEFQKSLSAEFKQIHEKGKLHIAMFSEDRFPYFFVNDQGELSGSDVRMAYDIAHQIGVEEVVFDRSAQTYEEIIDLVAENQVDLAISKISATLNRAQRVMFSEPYVTLKQAVLLNRIEFAKIKTEQKDPIAFLKANEVKIGVVSGTSYNEFADEIFALAKIIPFPNKASMLQAVQAGEVMAAFYDAFEFKRYVTDQPNALIDLQMIVMDERNDYLAVGIPPSHVQMQAWLKQYFAYQAPLDLDEVLAEYRDQYNELEGEG